MAIEGNLRELKLQSLLQMLSMEGQRTKVIVCGKKRTGMIFLDHGEIVHAEAGPLAGVDAIYDLLSWQEGSFRVRPQAPAPAHTVEVNTMRILMNGAKRNEKRRAQKKALFNNWKPTKSLSKADIAMDQALEQELFSLLGRLEQLKAQMEKRSVRKKPLAALRIFERLINSVIQCNETLPGMENHLSTFQQARNRALRHLQSSRVEAQNNRISLAPLEFLYHDWQLGPDQRSKAFRQICQRLIQFIESYFKFDLSLFGQRALAEDWKSSYEIFLHEFEGTVEAVVF